jgi:hypothetical protein
MAVAKTPSYYDTATIMGVKSFIAQATGSYPQIRAQQGAPLRLAPAFLTNVRVLWKRICQGSTSFCHSGSHKSNSNGIYNMTKIALISPEPTQVKHLLGAPL